MTCRNCTEEARDGLPYCEDCACEVDRYPVCGDCWDSYCQHRHIYGAALPALDPWEYEDAKPEDGVCHVCGDSNTHKIVSGEIAGEAREDRDRVQERIHKRWGEPYVPWYLTDAERDALEDKRRG